MVRALAALMLTLVAACGSEDGGGTADCDTPCFLPPDAMCDGTVRQGFTFPGECVDGLCVFPPVVEDCADDGQLCEAGECVDPPDPCESVTCDEPPGPVCSPDDDSFVITFAESGTCSSTADGTTSCDYEQEEERCLRREMCMDGACVPRPCYNVDCEEPLATFCDGTVIVSYEATGTCDVDTEECVYAEAERVDCADDGEFCLNARCVVPDPCEDVSCEEQPEDTCEDDVLKTYRRGFCSAGLCDYGETVRDCTDEGMICRNAECRFRLPCEDVVCDEPPRTTCDGTEVVEYASTGTCDEDECSYDETRTECADLGLVCFRGECQEPDPCDGISCDNPPDAYCEDDVAVSFADPGTCTGAICSYEELRDDCAARGETCNGGECEEPDPCADVVCDTPPPSECQGNDRIVYTLPSTCNLGECRWFRAEVDCTETFDICEDGQCVPDPDPCAGVVCDDLPEPECADNVRYYYEGFGSCVEGDCEYDDAEIGQDCTALGRVCTPDACLASGRAMGPGDAVITEFSVRGADAWVEIVDRTGRRDLSGLILRNASNQLFTLPDGTMANDDGYAVLASRDLAIPGTPTAIWPETFTLDPSEELLQLIGTGVVDSVSYDATDDWPDATVFPVQLDAANVESGLNDTPEAWCASPYSVPGALGTPMEPNGGCSPGAELGDLLIYEFMPDGNARVGGLEQWIEIHNTSDVTISLGGLRVATGTAAIVLPVGLEVDAGDYYVIAADSFAADGPDYVYAPDFELDLAGVVSIQRGEAIFDLVDYSTWTVTTGASLGRVSPASSSEMESAWCTASTSYPGPETNFGTPGSANDCD